MICIKHYIHRQSLAQGIHSLSQKHLLESRRPYNPICWWYLILSHAPLQGNPPSQVQKGRNTISSHTTDLISIRLRKILTSSFCNIVAFYVYLNTFEPHFLLAFLTKRSTAKPSEPPMYIHAKPQGQLFIRFHLNRFNYSLSLLLLPISIKQSCILGGFQVLRENREETHH